jgi:hypothetical protein
MEENITMAPTMQITERPTLRPTPQPSEVPAGMLSSATTVFDLAQLSVGECTKFVVNVDDELGMDFRCPLSGLLPGMRLDVWVAAGSVRDVADNRNERSPDLLLVNGVLGLTVVVAGPGLFSSLPYVPFRFTWSQSIQRSAFTRDHIQARDVATGDELIPRSELMLELGKDNEDSKSFVIYYESAGVTTMEVLVLQGKVLDDFGFGNKASNAALVNITDQEYLMTAPQRLCSAQCENGACDVNGTCLCSADYEHESDWWRYNDCSVPTSTRRALFITSAILCGMFLVFALYSVAILPKDRGFLRTQQRFILALVVVWALSRGAFYVYRLLVTEWDVVDALLLAVPLAVIFVTVLMSLEVHLSFMTSTTKHISNAKARIGLLLICFLVFVNLVINVISDELLTLLGLEESRNLILTVGLAVYTGLFVLVLLAYILIVRAKPKDVITKTTKNTRRSFSAVPEPIVTMDAATRLYLTLRQRRREGYGAVEAKVEHVSRGGLKERLFFVAALVLLSHIGLIFSPLSWEYFLAWRWTEFVMILVILWAHRKQIKLAPVGLRNQVKPFVKPDDDDDDEETKAPRIKDPAKTRLAGLANETRMSFHKKNLDKKKRKEKQAKADKKKKQAAAAKKKKGKKKEERILIIQSSVDDEGDEEDSDSSEVVLTMGVPDDSDSSEGQEGHDSSSREGADDDSSDVEESVADSASSSEEASEEETSSVVSTPVKKKKTGGILR